MPTDKSNPVQVGRRPTRAARALAHQRRAPRVVCIDDDPDFLCILAGMLGRLGVSVETAPGAIEGYRTVLRTRPDLVITDYFLPHEQGTYLLRQLKRFPFTCRLPVVVVTGRDMTVDVCPPRNVSLDDRLRALGAEAVLSKPLAEPLLRETIHRYLS